ncbi:hypothetical protein Golob_027905, partial [Gossypium lobatum]|nr:hypothetical protein [Gossypium lobatum]
KCIPLTELGPYGPIIGEDRGICRFRIIQPSKYGPRQRSKRNVIVLQRGELVPTVEEYTTLMIKEMNEQWALGHIVEAVSDLVDRLDKRITPILVILAKTFRPLNAFRRACEGRKFYIDVEISTEFLYLGYGELLDMLIYSCSGSIDRGNSYQQHKGWPSVSFPTRSQRVNDNIPMSNQETTRSLEGHLQVVPAESEIINQDFEKRSLELGKKIEQLEEKKMCLGLDIDIHKLEAEKLRKENNKAEEDFNSLKTDYKKLCLSIKTAGLGKMLEQWRQKIKEEKTKAGLRTRVAELEKSLHQYRNRNSVIELRSFLRGVINSDKSSSIVLKAKLEKETTSWVKLWLKY